MSKTQRNYLILGLLLLLNQASSAQPGSLDSTFNGNGIVRWSEPNRRIGFERVRLQPDGKILGFGNIEDTLNTQYMGAVRRFLPDGSNDPDFADDGLFHTDGNLNYLFGFDGDVKADGKILLMNDVLYANAFAFTQLQSDGSRDLSFGWNNSGTAYPGIDYDYFSPYVYRMVRQPDNKMLGIGYFWDFNTDLRRGFIARFLENGALDSTFSADGLVGIFPQNNTWELGLRGGKVQPDGKIVLVGRCGSASIAEYWYLTRLMPDGSIDASFGTNGFVQLNLGDAFSESANEVVILPDGKIIAGGFAQKLPGQHFTLLRFLPNGTLDNSFGFGGKAQVSFDCCYSFITDLVVQPDGKIVACGYSQGPDDVEKFSVARLKPNGALDLSFGTQGKVVVLFDHSNTSARATSVALQPDGKILLSGVTDTIVDNYYTNIDALLVRLQGDGNVATGNPGNLVEYELSLSPNPVNSGSLYLDFSLPDPAEVELQLFDLYGRKLAAPIELGLRPEGAQSETIHLPGSLSGGAYLLAFRTENGIQYSKFVVGR